MGTDRIVISGNWILHVASAARSGMKNAERMDKGTRSLRELENPVGSRNRRRQRALRVFSSGAIISEDTVKKCGVTLKRGASSS